MFLLRSRFERGLRHRAREMCISRAFLVEGLDRTMESIDIDFQGFYSVDEYRLGELAALILGQAQSDGASRIQLYYGKNRMVYTLDHTDYDMVPCPSPMNVDLVRRLGKVSGMKWDAAGLLSVPFGDLPLTLTVTHVPDTENPYVEIGGFSGKPCVVSRDADTS